MSSEPQWELPQSVQSLLPHLEELRRRLMAAVLALVVGAALAFMLAPRLLAFLTVPIGGLEELQAIELTEPISVYMRVSLLAGAILAMPVIVYEVMAFVTPGLLPHERRGLFIALPFIFLSFLAGAAFAYYVMLPVAVPFLANFGGIQGNFRVSSYLSFTARLILWVGVAFEMPLIIAVLARLGIVTPQILRRGWRVAVAGIAILAALITPTVDPVNMAIVMLPLLLLYGLSIVLATWMYRLRGVTSNE
ncbi:MAG TPA: twin-arginine translocase subunit TatC [Anaerolineae bacterium]|nr:twin-arginine translocase subunit TatC [Anaerolineae bacterium]HNU04219.1 twin-arginine translocase subunit TatC [Anaerolineae bacterium]